MRDRCCSGEERCMGRRPGARNWYRKLPKPLRRYFYLRQEAKPEFQRCTDCPAPNIWITQGQRQYLEKIRLNDLRRER